jgi:ribosomal-protein-alanine N-acetyltransferase
MILRPAKKIDLAEVLAIEKSAFPYPWSEAIFCSEINRLPTSLYVLTKEPTDPARGYLCFWHLPQEIQLLNIAVHPDCRRQGHGRFMMEALLNEARLREGSRIFLEVRPSNQAAVGLYQTLGFKTLYRRPRYYASEGEDALVMQWAVSNSRHG